MTNRTWADEMEVFRPKNCPSDQFFNTWISEALFGWAEISPFTGNQSRGLEIGAGSGLLAARMSKSLEEIIALEPTSDTFSINETILNKIKEASYNNLIISRMPLEDFEDETGFDLIWSINVFEHLNDWKAGLLKTHSLLRPGGRAIILCPNYDIPYESHFGLPVLGTKKITQRVFKKKIDKFERKYSCVGLWKTLNFIRISQIIKFAHENNLEIKTDKTITDRLFDRVTTDMEFAKRHEYISPVIRLVRKTRLLNIWTRLPAKVQPYIALHIFADKKA